MIIDIHEPYVRTLAIDPTTDGFGFVVLENEYQLLDWRFAVVRTHHVEDFMVRIEQLVDKYSPVLIIVEELFGSKQRKRAAKWIEALKVYAGSRKILLALVSRSSVRRAFDGVAKNREEIAAALVQEFPELAHRVPPKRQIWMSEARRMHIFDALSFAVALRDDRGWKTRG